MVLLKKFIAHLKNEGLAESLKQAYNYLHFRIKIRITRVYLKLKSIFKQPPFPVRHGTYNLNFSNDGDYEEILYHSHWKYYFCDEKNKIKKFVNDGNVVLDVGANIGLFSLILSDLVGECGQVYSFEPIPQLHKKLINNINLNKLTNIKTIESGVGDTESETDIYLNPEQSGLSSAVAKPSSNYVAQKIKITSLDKFSANLQQKVSFIKIDTEGYEPIVLRGASELIKRDKPIIYIELGGDHQKTSAEALKILKEYNYSCEAENIDLTKTDAGNNFIALPK